MADNIAISQGSGTTIATDDIGGVQYQRVKTGLGADGSATDWVGGTGTVSSAVGRVTVATDDVVSTNLVTLGGTVTSSRVAVNPISGQAGITGGSGVVGAACPRVTVATDDVVSSNLVTLGAAVSSTAVKTVGFTVCPSANFTRPADTTAYASGDLVANSTTAGSVTALSWTAARIAAGAFRVVRARLKKSGTTTTLASFRLHLYGAQPTVTNGDNGAWLTTQSTYLGSFDLDISGTNGRVFSDASEVIGSPAVGSEVRAVLASGTTVYGLLEARAAYTPGSAEVFTVELEIEQLN